MPTALKAMKSASRRKDPRGRPPIPLGQNPNKFTFSDYVMTTNVTRNARGELILDWQDLIRLKQFPPIKSWADVKKMMEGKDEAERELIRRIWRTYLVYIETK